jgi:simple sugar transport system ATP-binding protein
MIGRKLDPLTIDVADRSQDQPALECVGLRGRAGVRGRLDGASLHVNHGEIVGVAGVAGSGQSHLVESIFGLREFAGELKVLGQNIKPLQTAIVRSLGVGLVPEDRLQQGLWLEGSCHMNMVIGLEDRFLKSHIFQFDQLRAETQQWARDFDVRAPSLETPAGSLSGGNQQKLIFAREVSGRTPQLLICHQPTRGVDLGAIDLIHRRLLKLRNEGLGVLVLSSELDELLKICDRLYVFFEGQVAAEFKRGEFDRLKIGAAMAGVTHGA